MKWEIYCQFLKTFEFLPFLSVLMNLFHPMAPAEFISQLLLSFHIFTCLLDYFSFFFTSFAFCTFHCFPLSPDVFNIYRQYMVYMVLCLPVLSWIHFDLISLSSYPKKASYYCD